MKEINYGKKTYTTFSIQEQDFYFNYGLILIREYGKEDIVINKGIRIGQVRKVALSQKNYVEIQICYKDDIGELQCLKLKQGKQNVAIVYKGNMQIEL